MNIHRTYWKFLEYVWI